MRLRAARASESTYATIPSSASSERPYALRCLSQLASGSSQFVLQLRLAERLLEIERRAAPASSGQAPTSVWSDEVGLVRDRASPPSSRPRRAPPTPPDQRSARRAARARRRSASCRASSSRAGRAGGRAQVGRVEVRRPRARSGPGRRRPRSARRSGSSGRRPCPRRPSPAPAASSAGSGRTNASWPRSSSRRIRASSAGSSALVDRLAVGRRPTCRASGLDVGAVDVERGERPRRRRQSTGSFACELLRLGREGRPRLLELRLGGDLRERPPLAGQLLVEPGQRLLGRGVDEERRHVVQELVARRPLDRPVGAAARRGSRIFSTQIALDPGLAQPLEVAARVGEPVRMVDPNAVDDAVARQLDHLRVRRLPDLRVLHRAPRPARRRRRSGGASRCASRGRRTSPARAGRARTGSRRPPPCGSGRCRARRRARAAASARSSSSPPSASETRVGSTTS